AVTGPHLFGYRKTPYDDLLGHLTDRDAAATVGRAVIGTTALAPHETATALRKRFTNGASLATVIAADLAGARLAEAKGWVLPDSLAQLCALAVSP
ncbi:MAG: hypothetical protein JO294_01460, partial [Alphaproteobacteria bacterium]|nr:hypothetical protein [Alphaproteobacteria bacterium]